MKTDQNDYKRDEERGKIQIEEYERGQREWEKSRVSTAYLPPHVRICAHTWAVCNANVTTFQLRSEDDYDQRQSLAATAASRSYQSADEKRNDHNNKYIGHWPRGKRKGHKDAVTFAREKAVKYGKESQEHRDVRRLASSLGSLANLGSLVIVAGATIASRIWTNTSQKKTN